MKLAEVRTPLVTVLVAVALVIGGVATHGQRPQGGGAAGPMLVDFTAVGADGKPVTDLTAADVTIKIAGKNRAITDLALKKIAAAAPAAGAPAAAAATAPATSGPAAPFFTNDASGAPAPAAASGGRAFLIVVDNESLPSATEAPIKAAIENLLKDLTPADRVAFSTAPKDTAQIGFGSSLKAVRDAVAGFRGLRGVTTNDALCRTSETLNLLKALIQQTPGGDTPTAVIVIAGSLSTPGTSSSTTGGNCNVATDHYQSLASAMASARANMYVVQGDSAAGRDNGMENLASVSGAGSVMRVANEGFAPRVLGEASTYWVATVAPDASDKPNQSQRLELKTTKEGVTVRSRPEVMMARVANAAGAPAAPGGKADPKMMVTSTTPYPDVQLRMWALSQRGVGNKMNVLVQVEPVDPTVKLTAVRLGYFDANNKGGSLDVTNIAVFPITTGVPLDVGQYRLRAAVTDANGKAGAVDMKLDTSLISAGPFKMSGLMLLLAKDGKNSPRLQFTEGDKVAAMFEMYGVPNATPMAVGFEVVMPDGTVKQFRPTGQMPSNEPDKFTIFGDVPDLPAGDYVVRGVVQQQGAERGVSSRTLRILKK